MVWHRSVNDGLEALGVMFWVGVALLGILAYAVLALCLHAGRWLLLVSLLALTLWLATGCTTAPADPRDPAIWHAPANIEYPLP